MFVSFWRELPAENSQHFWKSNNVKRRSLTSYYFSNKTYLWRVEMYRWLGEIISIKRIICLRSFSNLLKNFVIVQIVYLEMKYKLLLYYKISPDINMINIGNKHFNVLLVYCWRVDDFGERSGSWEHRRQVWSTNVYEPIIALSLFC